MVVITLINGTPLSKFLYPPLIRESLQDMGIASLKLKQEEAILSFLDGKDTFVSLPTGYGKSLIYALLPLIFDNIRDKLNRL